ncbi:MAG TPA: hypothetical protein VHA75_05630, partial [Rugosimonospora sp.]|nr:hypothetical protein [Rugosimonospora sp.]
ANGAQANGAQANGAHPNGAHPNGARTNGGGANGAQAGGASYPDTEPARGVAWGAAERTTGVLADVPGPLSTGVEPLWGKETRPARRRAREDAAPVLPDAIKRQVGDLLPRARGSARTAEQPAIAAEPADPGEPAGPARREGALRRLVHATLDERVPPGDRPDSTKLMALVTDELQLSDLEQASANHYVHSWRQAREVSAS